MNISEHHCPKECWEVDFHQHNDSDIAIMGMLAFPFHIYKYILIGLKKRKIAKIKTCKCCWKIQIQCPYCQNITIQKNNMRNYICPFCYKKSYIETYVGLLSLLFKKKYN